MKRSMKHHLSSSIEGLLMLSDKKLEDLFQMKGSEVRKELLERQSKGELLIPSANCEGFCPINGCPGHPYKKGS